MALQVELSGMNLTFVAVVGVIAILALVMALYFRREVLAASEGTENMRRIALAVQEGASAYLGRQFRTLTVFAVVAFFLLLFLPAHGDAGFGHLDPEDRPVRRLPRRCDVLRPDRLHGHVAGRAGQRPGGRRRA